MAAVEPLLNQEFLGRCYDIVTLDPLDLASSAKYVNAVDMSVDDGNVVDTRGRKILVPPGVNPAKVITSMSWESQSRLISSSYEFQQEFKIAVEAEAGVEGVFEFSGSASTRQMESLTQTRKQTFVYSRAYQQNHGLELNLADADAPVKLTEGFSKAVRNLPVGEFSAVRGAYDEFVKTFGTHFTKEIILGGMAFQRTSGLASRWLSSREKEEELKAKASAEVEAVKAGVGTEMARSEAKKVDNENSLERTQLEFRGGTGSPNGINDDWIQSLDDRPTIIKAKLEKLTKLLTRRFFPDVADIEDRQGLLDIAIYTWIKTKGTPGCDKQPLQYGERFALGFIFPGKQLPTPGLFWADKTGGSLFWPRPGQKSDRPIAIVTIERASGRGEGTILAGDEVRVRVTGTPALLQLGDTNPFNSVANADTVFTIHHHGDDPARPSRLGEYFLEADSVQLTPAGAGRAGWRAMYDNTKAQLRVAAMPQGWVKTSALALRRIGVDAPDSD